jgi:ornithine cyclodeaminase/alanine dehydrogenase-like protein (mu-crystallin family)
LVSEAKPALRTIENDFVQILGMALEDLVAADLAYRKAVEKGIVKSRL